MMMHHGHCSARGTPKTGLPGHIFRPLRSLMMAALDSP